MIQNFRGKKVKDIESASDSIMHNAEFLPNHRNTEQISSTISSSLQQTNVSTFDNYIEKKNKEL